MLLAGASTLQTRHCAACTGPATGKRTVTVLVFRGAAASDPTRRATVSTGINVYNYCPRTPRVSCHRAGALRRSRVARWLRPIMPTSHSTPSFRPCSADAKWGTGSVGALVGGNTRPCHPCQGSNKLNEGATQIESDPLPHPSHCRQDMSFRSRDLRRVTFLPSQPRPNPRRPTRQQHSSSPHPPSITHTPAPCMHTLARSWSAGSARAQTRGPRPHRGGCAPTGGPLGKVGRGKY